MEIAGIPHELICWRSVGREQTLAAYGEQVRAYREDHGHEPGERAAYRLARIAADRARVPKGAPRPLRVLRAEWRASAVRRVGESVVDRLLRLARAAAAAVWAHVRAAVAACT